MVGIARLLDPDHPRSLTRYLRGRRTAEFSRRFPALSTMRVLDLGGTVVSWRVLGLRPAHVTIVNLRHREPAREPWMTLVTADACAGDFGQFDLVYSNSLMEHLGGHARRAEFAAVVRESAGAWWVQTPYRYFPIEPHWIFPGFQFLPFAARVAVCRRWKTLHLPPLTDPAEAAAAVASIELISATEMRAYFPDGQIWYERVAGLPKSLVSVRTGSLTVSPSTRS